MGKKKSIKKQIINVAKDVAMTGASLLQNNNAMAGASLLQNNTAVFLAVASISVLAEIGNLIIDYYEKNKHTGENELIEQMKQLEPIRACDSQEKDTYIRMAGKVFKNMKLETGSSISINVLLPKIKELLENEYPDTTEQSYCVLAQLVYFEIAYLEMNGNAEKLSEYVVSENNARKNENDLANKRIEEVDNKVEQTNARMELVERKVDSISICTNGHIEREGDKIDQVVKEYADKYSETLYLHKGSELDVEDIKKRVSLRNLYDETEVVKVYSLDNKHYETLSVLFPKEDTSDKEKDKNKFLILLGDAGSGKTSLIQRLAYQYLYGGAEEDVQDFFKNHDNVQAVFKNHELIIIKLRDIDRTQVEANGIYKAICKYLNVENDNNGSWFEGKCLILDGMDELYTGKCDPNYRYLLNLIYEIFKNTYKLIITSRPGIEEEAEKNYTTYKICPYGPGQKHKWIERYEEIAGEISEEIRDILNNEVEKKAYDDNSIFDYPQLLYMIAASKPNEGNWSIKNRWSIYHHILFEKSFEQQNVTEKTKPYKKIRKKIYTALQRIAYDLYKNGSPSKISKARINEILKNNTESKNNEQFEDTISSFAYRFGCYWVADRGDSEVEFYHNNIRDYYIAEYLSSKLNKIFKEIVNPEIFKEYETKGYESIHKALYDLLGSFPIHKEVVEFMASKIAFIKDLPEEKKGEFFRDIQEEEPEVFYKFLQGNHIIKGIDYENDNCNQKSIEVFMKELYSNLNIYADADEHSAYSSIIKISSFLRSYLTIVCKLLSNENDEYKIGNIIGSQTYSYIRPILCLREDSNYCYLGKVQLSQTNLLGAKPNLIGANFNEMDLRGADLRGSFLREAKLWNADFSGANLSSTLLIRGELHGVKLIKADLNGAIFDDAQLEDASLTGAQLRWASFFNANLRGADLREAILFGAYLCKAKLSNVLLNKAILRRADLREADMFKAILNNAVLSEANLKNSKLRGADLREADLTGADLTGADLTGAVLAEADLTDADLTGAIYTINQIRKAKTWHKAKNVHDI